MLNDILPAARWGCKTALFAGDKRSYRPREAQLGATGIQADLLITDLMQIPGSLA
jgi:putative hydrolase of the HAD superfamily